MGVVVQILLASVYIIAVECHLELLNNLGLPSIHSILHGNPGKHHRWHHNIFNPAFSNQRPNMYDTEEMGYGHGSGMHQGYGPDGTILSYNNYGPDNRPHMSGEFGIPENPNYHGFNDNANGVQNVEGFGDKDPSVQPDDSSHLADDRIPSHEGTYEEQKTETPEFNKPNGYEVNEKSEDGYNEHDSKADKGEENDVTKNDVTKNDVTKNKLQEGVVVYQQPKTSVADGDKINKPNTNLDVRMSNPIPLASGSSIQNVPGVANNIIVPLSNAGVGQLNPVAQIIGTDAATGLPVVNVNGALYLLISPATNQVTTTIQKPAQIVLVPTNSLKPLNMGTQVNAVPNPSYIILNGNGQLLQPVNGQNVQPIVTGLPLTNGISTNGRVKVEDIISYVQQHPEILQQIIAANTATNSQPAVTNPDQGGGISNRINVPTGTPSTASPAGYQPVPNVGSQTNKGITSNQAADAIISFILQHPEIFGSNTVSNNAPNPNTIYTANVVPNSAETSTAAPNTNQNVPNMGPSNNDLQGIIAFITQHPEIFSANAVVTNNEPKSTIGTSSNVQAPVANQGTGPQVNNGIETNVAIKGDDLIAYLTKHPEIFSANAVLPNNDPNSVNNGINTANTQPNPDQGSRNSFSPNDEPKVAIGGTNNVKVPDSPGNNGIATNDAAKAELIAYLTQHPEIYGPKSDDANNAGSKNPIEDKNSNNNGNSQGTGPANPSPSGESNGNTPSYLIVHYPGDQTTNKPPNDSPTGLPLKTNLYNNEGNNGNADNDVSLALGLTDTKDLESVRVNKKPGVVHEFPKMDGVMSPINASKDEESESEKNFINIPPPQVPEVETTTEKA